MLYPILLIVLPLQGCEPNGKLPNPKNMLTAAASGVEERTQVNGLGIHGYNYTDTSIAHFSVNGSGGMGLEVHDTVTFGGGTVCCASVSPILMPYKMTVQWTRDGEKWCETEAMVSGPIPEKPESLNVHFYQDGHIEIDVTDDYAAPRLKLDRYRRIARHKDGNVVNDEKFARCQIGRP